MITSREVYEVARVTGFRPDVVEKVLRLRGILARLDHHPITRGAWLLKGGTALNLLHLKIPRLSVDIDLDFIGAQSVDEMREARPAFEGALESVCEREDLTIKRVPTEHAGGKFRMRFASVVGGPQSLEVDVSYVARVPLLGTERRATLFPPGDPIEVTTLPIIELAAGKFTALMQRAVPRDAFDAAILLSMQPGLMDNPDFRLAFVCSMAGGRTDPRDLLPYAHEQDPKAIEQQLVPLLRLEADGSGPDSTALLTWIGNELKPVVDHLLDWSDAERRFLDRLQDEGIVDAEILHPDRVIQE